MELFMIIIKDITTILGCISAIVGFMVMVSKGVRGFLKNLFIKYSKDLVEENETQNNDIKDIKEMLMEVKKEGNEYHLKMEQQVNEIKKNNREFQVSVETRLDKVQEGTKDMLRHRIMTMYRRYKDSKTIPENQKDMLEKMYSDYKGMNGNSYIDKYYRKMSKWVVIEEENEEC